MIKVSTTGMAVSLKTDLRFPISGQWGHGDRIIHFSDIIGNRHKNPFFTSNVYTHLKLEDAQREMERLERIEKVCQVRK